MFIVWHRQPDWDGNADLVVWLSSLTGGDSTKRLQHKVGFFKLIIRPRLQHGQAFNI